MLNRTITVVIADFELLKENNDCTNRFKWYNISNGTLLTNAQEIDVLELPKLPKEDNGKELWRWLRFFKSKEEDEMEELAKDSKEMQNVMVTLRQMSADEAERRLAEQADKDAMDRRAEIEFGRRRGYEEGIEIGKSEGIEIGQARGVAQEKADLARRMKEEGISLDSIARVTGLSPEEIATL